MNDEIAKLNQRLDKAGQLVSELISRVASLEKNLDYVAAVAGILPSEPITVGFIMFNKSETKGKYPKDLYTLMLYAAYGNAPYPILKLEVIERSDHAIRKQFMSSLLDACGVDRVALFGNAGPLEGGYKAPKLDRDNLSPYILKFTNPVQFNAHWKLGEPAANGKRYKKYEINWTQIEAISDPLGEFDLKALEWNER